MARNAVLVAFKQRRCFSLSVRSAPRNLRGVGRFQTAKVFLRTWMRGGKTRSVSVLVAFKQRRCFSSRWPGTRKRIKGVGRFQTAKVFLPRVVRFHADIGCGVGRFQTAKVFLPNNAKENRDYSARCWSLSNSEGVSPQHMRSRCQSQGVGRFQTAKVFLPTPHNTLITR